MSCYIAKGVTFLLVTSLLFLTTTCEKSQAWRLSVRVSVRWTLMIIFSFAWRPDGRGAKELKDKFFSPSLSFPHFLFDVTAIYPLRLIQKNRNMFKISFTFWIWREMDSHSTLICSVLTKICIYLLPSRVKWKGGNCSGFRKKNFKALKTKLHTPRCWAL